MDHHDKNLHKTNSSNTKRKPSDKESKAIKDVPSSESMPLHMSSMSLAIFEYPGAESTEYNFALERPQVHYGTNLIESIAHLIKGCSGAGVLGIHEAFMHGGMWTSVAAGLVIGFLVGYSMMMLVQSAQTLYMRLRIPKLSYPDLAEVALYWGPCKPLRKYSKVFRYVVDLFLVIELFGACCVYQIIIAETLREALEGSISELAKMKLSTRIYILIIILPLMLICLIRTLKYLAQFAVAADIFVLITILVTAYHTFGTTISIFDRPAWKDSKGFYQFCGIYIFTVDGVGIALPIENNMKRPRLFNIVLWIGMSVVVMSSILVGMLGYWAWGEKCQSPITTHIPVSTHSIIMHYLFAIMLCVTFSINFWVPFKGIWHYIAQRHQRHHHFWERFYRVVHVLLISAISLSIPNMKKMMIFLGGFCLIFIGFVFPAFIDTLISWNNYRNGWIRWRLLKNILLAMFGFMVFFGVVYATFM